MVISITLTCSTTSSRQVLISWLVVLSSLLLQLSCHYLAPAIQFLFPTNRQVQNSWLLLPILLIVIVIVIGPLFSPLWQSYPVRCFIQTLFVSCIIRLEPGSFIHSTGQVHKHYFQLLTMMWKPSAASHTWNLAVQNVIQ